ncbi:MAG: lytic transglycosylase domain-containing protein [Clostridiales bacterium]|mgnify:FL=1|nr:lytic transglycosylase domain-containing protein [Clostridiales bacterium]
MRKVHKRRRTSRFFLVLILLIGLVALLYGDKLYYKFAYPIKYEDIIDKYAKENGVEKTLILAIIRTESGYDKNAVSSAGASGLMQMMEDAFEWTKFRMNDDSDTTYEEIFDPEISIKYGTYMLALLLDEYEHEEEAIAAYHAGRTRVNGWLSNKEYSEDGVTLDIIPIKETNHYVYKVMKAWDIYNSMVYDI